MAAPTEGSVPPLPHSLYPTLSHLSLFLSSVCLACTCGRALHLIFQLSACCADIDKLATQHILPPALLGLSTRFPSSPFLYRCPSVFYDSTGNIFAFKKQLIFISAAHTLATLSMAQKPIKSVLPARNNRKKRQPREVSSTSHALCHPPSTPLLQSACP